jgi:hypothetical protein
MKIPIAILPDNIIKQYKLQEKVLDGYIYMEIRKGKYGLLQAGILANKLLKEQLVRHGYFEQPHTPGLWKPVTHLVWSNLCVYNFSIKYIGCKHLQHLYNALCKETYEIVKDWTGNLYCGITLIWNHKKHHVDLAMLAYVKKQLTKYSHVAPSKPQHCPYMPNPIKYGKDNQAPSPLDKSPCLNKAQASNKLSAVSCSMRKQWIL